MTAIEQKPTEFMKSKTEDDGIHLDPKTYESCICGNLDAWACTFETFMGVDFYHKEFEPCKCACHVLLELVDAE